MPPRSTASGSCTRDRAITSRDTVAQRMTRNQIAEAQRRAQEWGGAHPRNR